MKELLFRRKDTIEIYDNSTTEIIYSVQNSGSFRKKIDLLDRESNIIITACSNLFRSNWVILRGDKIGHYKQRIFSSKVTAMITNESLILDKNGKFIFIDEKYLSQKFSIQQILPSGSLIVEDDEYLDQEVVCILTILIIRKYKLI